jgi:hypothetical protein
MDEIFQRMSNRWCVKWQFLKDVYFLMTTDTRFSSGKSRDGIRYARMTDHLNKNYRIELQPHKLKYLVYLVKKENYDKIRGK